MTLREVVHAHIPTLTADSTVRDAVDKMDVYQFPALVVVDADRAPIAVLTEGDLCRAVTGQDNLMSLGSQKAIVFASREPLVARADEEIGEAFHTMLMRGITLLPVVDDGVLSGVVLRVDLMQALLMDTARPE